MTTALERKEGYTKAITSYTTLLLASRMKGRDGNALHPFCGASKTSELPHYHALPPTQSWDSHICAGWEQQVNLWEQICPAAKWQEQKVAARTPPDTPEPPRPVRLLFRMRNPESRNSKRWTNTSLTSKVFEEKCIPNTLDISSPEGKTWQWHYIPAPDLSEILFLNSL